MRFAPIELTGSRVCVRYRVELRYVVSGPSEFLFLVHAANTPQQTVLSEDFQISSGTPLQVLTDQETGNRFAPVRAECGNLAVRYSACVAIEHSMAEPSSIAAIEPVALPVGALRYLYPSRYCQADVVQAMAWREFGNLPRGYDQVRTIRDWVKGYVQFRPGTSFVGTSAVDTLRDRTGVCRDFAHLMIAVCRALNYPARFVTAVDYGADPALGPPDFHAYVEVFLNDRWFIFDPSDICAATGLVRIATGRDAADVSFATIYGPVLTGMPFVEIDAVEAPERGFILPAPTNLAVSTAT